jgi:hypothetical protein
MMYFERFLADPWVTIPPSQRKSAQASLSMPIPSITYFVVKQLHLDVLCGKI